VRQTVTFPDKALVGAGTAAEYTVPAPANGMRVKGLVSVYLIAANGAAGVGAPVLRIFDRAGIPIASIPGSASLGVNQSREYTWARVAGYLDGGTTVAASIPCNWECEDGDVIRISYDLSAGTADVATISMTFDLEPV